MEKNKPELLAPAGNFEKLQVALAYGADAVYIGGKNFSLRAYGDNFDEEEILKAVEFTHERGKKIYVAANIFAHNADVDELENYFKFLDAAKVDAVLISDLGIFSLAKSIAKNFEIHVSTQANVTNYRAANFFHELGATPCRRSWSWRRSAMGRCAFRFPGAARSRITSPGATGTRARVLIPAGGNILLSRKKDRKNFFPSARTSAALTS